MMTRVLRPYSDYKDSGIPWLGMIPSHWGTRRAKWLFTRMNRPVRPEDETITCFRDGVVTLRKNRRTAGFTEALQEIGYQGIRKGDLVIHAMDAFAGAVGVSDSDGKGTPVYVVCKPMPGVNAEYYAWVVREMARSQYITALAKGIRQRSTDFRYATFAGEELPTPPPEEQHAIARFLGEMERRANRLIRAKQRLISLLKEQKQAVIQRAVTRGLDPNVRLKPLGVMGLGEVPEHWEVRPLWTLATPRKERNPGGLELLSVFLDRGVIPYGEGGGQVHAPSLDLTNYQVVRPGDFVLNNQQAWRGSVGVSRLHGIVSPAYIVLKMSEACHLGYMDYLLRSKVMVSQYVTASRGVGDIQRQIYWPHLRRVRVPLPPYEEQKAIADHLAHATQEITSAIAGAHREIQLIREYRTRIVSDVITGKLDVRGVKLPDEAHTADSVLDIDAAAIENELFAYAGE